MARYSTPNLTGINVTFMYSKSLFKISSRTYILFTTTLAGYQVNNILCVATKKPYFVFAFGSMTKNSVDATRKFLQISHLLLHFSVEQLFSFIVLADEDGDLRSFKFFLCICYINSVFWKYLKHFVAAM